MYKETKLDHGPKVVAIGGGTGLSSMLRALKKITSNITAVVTVADNGGNSGILRKELGVLPPEISELHHSFIRYRNHNGRCIEL